GRARHWEGGRGLRGGGCACALCLGRMGCDEVHQRRREAVVGLKTELLQPRAHGTHLLGLGAGLDDRGDKRREPRLFPALLLRQLDVDEVESMEWVALVLDAPVHVNAASGTRVALDRRTRVDDLELLAV